ncbi:hypothetical protein J6590_012045 [Homalodisca vitripennis]|nr:hypothetical protein J6590_012045 [Homalodisca vitripennis]
MSRRGLDPTTLVRDVTSPELAGHRLTRGQRLRRPPLLLSSGPHKNGKALCTLSDLRVPLSLSFTRYPSAGMPRWHDSGAATIPCPGSAFRGQDGGGFGSAVEALAASLIVQRVIKRLYLSKVAATGAKIASVKG